MATPVPITPCGHPHSATFDDNSDGFRPTLWGYDVWYFDFVTSWWSDREDEAPLGSSRRPGLARAALLLIYDSFQTMLFCMVCRASYAVFYAQDPPTPSVPMVTYAMQLKERVNRKLGKQPFPVLHTELFERLYVDTERRAMDEVQDVTPRLKVATWTMLYLAALNYAPPSASSPPSSSTNTTPLFLEAVVQALPAASRFHQVLKQSYIHTLNQDHWVSYFLGHRPGSAPRPRPALTPLQRQVSILTEFEMRWVRFATRQDLFHFVFEWETESRRRSVSPTTSKTAPSPRASMFGSSCFQVQAYFEQVYRGIPVTTPPS